VRIYTHAQDANQVLLSRNQKAAVRVALAGATRARANRNCATSRQRQQAIAGISLPILQNMAPHESRTMKTITIEMFDDAPASLRSSTKRGSAEASTLRLKPGEWPESFKVEGLGTFTPYYSHHDGSVEYYNGDPEHRAFFTIFND
jgi:hypothetical protein